MALNIFTFHHTVVWKKHTNLVIKITTRTIKSRHTTSLLKIIKRFDIYINEIFTLLQLKLSVEAGKERKVYFFQPSD